MTFVAGPHDPNAYDVLTSSIQSLTAEIARMRDALARVTATASDLASRLPECGPEATAAIYLANIALRRSDVGFGSQIAWAPIEAAPPSVWDGRQVLLWLRAPHSRPALLSWSANAGLWLEGEEMGEGDCPCGTGALVPSHYAEVAGPDCDRTLMPADKMPGFDDLLRLVEAMVTESGDPTGFDAAEWLARWLDAPMPGLGGKRPADHMGTDEGRAFVSRLLEMARDGVYA